MSSDKLAKFEQLKRQRQQNDKLNRKALYKEFQIHKTTPENVKRLVEKQKIAQVKLLELDASKEELARIEKSKLWDYSVEDNEKWQTKLRSKTSNKQAAKVIDYDHLAEKTYLKRVDEIDQKRKASKDSKEDLDIFVDSLKDAAQRKMDKVEKVQKDSSDGSYINIKNKDFNRKLSKYYDKYL